MKKIWGKLGKLGGLRTLGGLGVLGGLGKQRTLGGLRVLGTLGELRKQGIPLTIFINSQFSILNLKKVPSFYGQNLLLSLWRYA